MPLLTRDVDADVFHVASTTTASIELVSPIILKNYRVIILITKSRKEIFLVNAIMTIKLRSEKLIYFFMNFGK